MKKVFILATVLSGMVSCNNQPTASDVYPSAIVYETGYIDSGFMVPYKGVDVYIQDFWPSKYLEQKKVVLFNLVHKYRLDTLQHSIDKFIKAEGGDGKGPVGFLMDGVGRNAGYCFEVTVWWDRNFTDSTLAKKTYYYDFYGNQIKKK
jgi:hypothetical protein